MAVKLINNNDDELILPFQFSWTDIPREINVPRSEMATGDGTRRAGKETIEEFSFTVEGTIWDIDRAENIDERDGIADFIQYTPIRVYQLPEDDRFVYAHVQNFNQNWQDERTQLDLSISFVALDPFFYSDDEHVIDSAMMTDYAFELGTVAMTPEPRFIQPFMPVEEEDYFPVSVWIPEQIHLDFDNLGNRVVYPIIEIETQSTLDNNITKNIIIENKTTGSIIELEETFEEGKTIEIATNINDELLVSVDDENNLNIANDEFLINSFFFATGNNEIEIRWEEDENASLEIGVNIKFKARWL